MSKTGLGKGLSALIPQTSREIKEGEENVTEIAVSAIVPNSFQPRRFFDEEKLKELASSIKEHGVVQPVVVRPLKEGQYELVVGERRWRACQYLHLPKIPAVIKEYTDEQMMELAVVENIQRQDLNPLEEAQAYKKLITEFNYTQEMVAQKVSKSRAFVANMVRLLNLPTEVLNYLSHGQLSVGQARPLLTLEDAELQKSIAKKIIKEKMTAREAEEYVRKIMDNISREKPARRRKSKLSPELLDIETRLREICGTKVQIRDKGNKGKIEIEYYNSDDLNRIISYFLQDESLL